MDIESLPRPRNSRFARPEWSEGVCQPRIQLMTLPADDSADQSIFSPALPETRIIAKAVPEPDQHEPVRELLRGLTASSFAEPGVHTYDLYETATGDAFYLFEICESREVFEKHKASHCRFGWVDRPRSSAQKLVTANRRCVPEWTTPTGAVETTGVGALTGMFAALPINA